MENLKKIKEELDKVLGRDEKALLSDLINEVRSNRKKTLSDKRLNSIEEQLIENGKITGYALKQLIETAKKLKVELPDQFKVWVINQQKSPDEIKVSNLSEIKFPKEIEIKKPAWYSIRGIEKTLVALLKEITLLPKRNLRTKIIDSSDPQRPVAVRLSDGRRFYKAIAGAIAQAKQAFPFATSRGVSKEALVNEDGYVKVIISDGTYDAGVDELGYLVTIEMEHHRVHEGNFYTVSDVDTSVDTALPKYWHIKTPDDSKRAHIRIQIATDTGGLIEFFENPTTTDDGTALTAYNNDRNSTNTSSFDFYYDPTVSADGTRIEVNRIGGGTERKIGGMARQTSEIILKQNEQYLIKTTPDANDAEISMNIGFYEVLP